MKRFLGNFTALLFLLILLVTFAGVATALVGIILPSKSSNFTSAHFKSPALPNILKSSNGLSKNFGEIASSTTLFLLILFPLLLVFLFKLIRSLNDDSEEENLSMSVPAIEQKTKNGNLYFLPILLSLFLSAIFMKTLYLTPLTKDDSLISKIVSGEKFYILLNSAFIYKAMFMEKDYTELVFSALERDRKEYKAFSEIEYWAVFGREGVTKKVNRNAVASKRLYIMYKDGKLNEASVFLAYQVAKNAGEQKKAKEIIEYLLKKNPHNKKYNNEYIYIMGRWS